MFIQIRLEIYVYETGLFTIWEGAPQTMFAQGGKRGCDFSPIRKHEHSSKV